MIQTKTVLKEYFETGDKPTQQQYWSLIDSLRHVNDKIPLDDLQEDVLSQIEFQSHLDDAVFNGNLAIQGNDLNFLGGTTDWKMYTEGDNLHIRETAIGDRVTFYDGGLTKFHLNNSVAEFNSNADASIKVSSNDNYTGIAFQDPLGMGYMFYHGNDGYSLDNDLQISRNDSQLIILDTDQSNVNIGDTQSSILLKGMYASGSIDNVFSQARLRLIKDQADGTAGSAFAIDVMNNAGGASVLTERLVIDSEGDFDFKGGSGTFGEVLTVNTSIGNSNLFGHHLQLGRDSNNFISASAAGGSLHFVVNGNILSSPSYVIDNAGNHDFRSGTAQFGNAAAARQFNISGISSFQDGTSEKAYLNPTSSGVDFYLNGDGIIRLDSRDGTANFAGLVTGSAGMTLGSAASTTTRNPQYLVFGGSAGSEYGMELGYDATRAKYSTRIITSSSQDISFGAMNAPATDHSDFTEYLVIQNGGDFDFKSGNAAFGGDVSLKNDKFLYLGDANNARLFANNTNTFFDGLTGNMYFRNQFDGGNMYFQVENLSGDDLDLIEIHGDTQDVLLRHANTSRLQTTSEGVNVYGELSVVKSGSASAHADTDLFVADSTAAGSTAQMQILGGNSANSNLFFSDTDDYAIGGIKYAHTNDEMIFRTGNLDIVSISDKALTIGGSSVTGQPRTNYKKDANSSNGWYVGYTNSADSDFGIYGYESDGEFKIFTDNTQALHIDQNQDTWLAGSITSNAGFATGFQAANAGAIRLENEDKITSRNNANTGNRTLMYLDSSNVLQLAEATDTNFGGKITAKDLQLNLQGEDVAYIYGENDAQLRIRDISGNGPWSGIGFGSSIGTDGFLYHNSVGQFFQVTHQLQLLTGAYIPDSNYIYFGSSNDFRISHDGSNTLMDNYTGDVHLRNFTDGGSIYFSADTAGGVSTTILALDATSADVNGEVKATSFTQNGANVFLNIDQHNTTTSKIYADANLRIEAGASANILFHVNGAERGRIDYNGLMTLNNGLTVTGNVTATDFIGDWNGKATSDVVSATGDVNEDVTGTKVFTDGLTIGFYGPTDEKAYLSAKDTNSSVTTNLLEYGTSGILKVLEPTKFNQGLEADEYKLTGLNTAPASATASGSTGDIRYTADHIYVCVASNTWKRVALATW